VSLDSVQLRQELSLTLTRFAIVDSGTSLLLGPDPEVQVLMDLIGARKILRAWVVQCAAKLPSISFVLGGKAFTFDVEDLIVRRSGHLCTLGIQGAADVPFWILGDVFMRKYYVQFDWGKKRLGFARSSASKGDNFV